MDEDKQKLKEYIDILYREIGNIHECYTLAKVIGNYGDSLQYYGYSTPFVCIQDSLFSSCELGIARLLIPKKSDNRKTVHVFKILNKLEQEAKGIQLHNRESLKYTFEELKLTTSVPLSDLSDEEVIKSLVDFYRQMFNREVNPKLDSILKYIETKRDKVHAHREKVEITHLPILTDDIVNLIDSLGWFIMTLNNIVLEIHGVIPSRRKNLFVFQYSERSEEALLKLFGKMNFTTESLREIDKRIYG